MRPHASSCDIISPSEEPRSPIAEARMRTILALAIVVSLLGPAAALDISTRPVGPVHDWSAGDLDRFDPAWVHVKFVEGSDVTLADGRFLAADRTDLAAVNELVTDARTLRRTFPGDRAKFRAWKDRGERASGVTGPDLSLWFDVELDGDRVRLAATINALNARPEVEIAHPAPVCDVAAIHEPQAVPVPADPDQRTPDFTDMQDYLYDPPVGLDAPAAWAFEGGRGAGMKYIDVELGWTWTHEDFDPFKQFYQGGIGDPGYIDHGTAVMGEVVGRDNGYGVTGFAPDTRWGTVGITVDEWPDVPHYFLEAAEALDPGDVWLIELQMYPPGRDATPMEWLQVNYDVIWTSSYSLDVVCVEAGANGSQDLDASYWDGVFDRGLRDSGAIMVGAGTPSGRVAEWFTNHGSRMDVHAWGSEIVTTGYGDLYSEGTPETMYTSGFGGTSGASPMITGSALCLQGIAKATLGAPLTPIELRTLLNETGIPELGSQLIGPRPDLGAAVAELVDVSPVREMITTPGLELISALSPFSGETVLRFRQARAAAARLEVFDLAGRHVRTVALDAAAAGPRMLQWDGRDARGRSVGSGVYVFRLSAGRDVVTGRLVKVR
ncbi:S8 family serine peptidase [bacterium]|nr:S8 family serine peptidase [bacterium]